jgi:hypothetical protein
MEDLYLIFRAKLAAGVTAIRRSDNPKKIAAPTPWSRSPMAHHQS